MTFRRRSLPAGALIALAGCGGGSPSGAPQATPTPRPAAALTRADVPTDCRPVVPATARTAPEGLLDPPARLAVARIDGDSVTGFLDRTPGQFLAAWRARGGAQIDGEDEGIEGEVYVTAGERRVSWKLRKACRTGSTFTARIGGTE